MQKYKPAYLRYTILKLRNWKQIRNNYHISHLKSNLVKYSDTSRNITVASNQQFNSSLAYHSTYICSGNSKYCFLFSVSFSRFRYFLNTDVPMQLTSYMLRFTFKNERKAVQCCKSLLQNHPLPSLPKIWNTNTVTTNIIFVLWISPKVSFVLITILLRNNQFLTKGSAT
jgi:hypothetical protein